MTLHELGSALSKMYHESADGEAVAMIHLFGVKYADEIRISGESMRGIVLAAGLPQSYSTEVAKGVKLSKYVHVK
jgi:hypothetical protein